MIAQVPSLFRPDGAAIRTDATADGFDLLCLRSQDALEASFAPQVGMACCSLRHRGAELLDERFGLEAYANCGMTMGMSLMHPWADRLSSWRYTARGVTVPLPVSPLLHTDGWGLPVNGVQSSGPAWALEHTEATGGSAWLDAALQYGADGRQLALFPFPHRVHLHAEVTGRTFRADMEIEATGGVAVPVCFGYRLYLARERVDAEGTIVLPARRRIATDEQLLPTGPSEPLAMSASTIGIDNLHEVFSLGTDRRLTVASDVRRLTLEPLGGFPLAQVRSVPGDEHVMFEALTAEPDALSHDSFPVATPGRPYRASLQVSVEALCSDRSRLAG